MEESKQPATAVAEQPTRPESQLTRTLSKAQDLGHSVQDKLGDLTVETATKPIRTVVSSIVGVAAHTLAAVMDGVADGLKGFTPKKPK